MSIECCNYFARYFVKFNCSFYTLSSIIVKYVSISVVLKWNIFHREGPCLFEPYQIFILRMKIWYISNEIIPPTMAPTFSNSLIFIHFFSSSTVPRWPHNVSQLQPQNPDLLRETSHTLIIKYLNSLLQGVVSTETKPPCGLNLIL